MSQRETEIRNLQRNWAEDPRWQGIKRGYGAEDVVRLRGSVMVEHTLARRALKNYGTCCIPNPLSIPWGR